MRFTKMHGLGNDFIMIDAVTQSLNLSRDVICQLANRHTGIGCDQLLLVEPPQTPDADFRYRIFNADGGEVENCGNGARCFAQFVRESHLTGKSSIVVETMKGNMVLKVQDNDSVTVDMGIPVLLPADIPFQSEQQAHVYQLAFNSGLSCDTCSAPLSSSIEEVELCAVSMGNPHAILRVDSVAQAPLATLGVQIQSHERFPQGVNVGFMSVLSRNEIDLRVLERGVGETLACGTGACAAVVAGIINNWLDSVVTVNLRGGSLTIEWQGEGHSVIKTGTATTVFEGKITL